MITRYGVSSCLAFVMIWVCVLAWLVCRVDSANPVEGVACHIDQHQRFPGAVRILEQLPQMPCVARRIMLQRQGDAIRVRVL